MRKKLVALVMCLISAASAAAAITVPDGQMVPETNVATVAGPYLVPFAVSSQLTATYGTTGTYSLKTGAWQGGDWLGPGNFGLADLGNGSGRDQISGAAQNTVNIGDLLPVMPGNKIGQERQGMHTRLDQSYYADNWFAQWVADGCPLESRVVVCPVIQDTFAPINGREPNEVIGFTAFWLDAYTTDATGIKTITGRFVSAMSPDLMATYSTPEPSGLMGLSIGATGLFALRRRREVPPVRRTEEQDGK